jgi:putative ABC transport system substrate-binding protein
LGDARPESLPVAQPTKIELTVNKKIARQIGVAVPVPLLLRAGKLIE